MNEKLVDFLNSVIISIAVLPIMAFYYEKLFKVEFERYMVIGSLTISAILNLIFDFLW